MSHPFGKFIWGLAVLAVLPPASPIALCPSAFADLVKLKNGGELRGTLLDGVKSVKSIQGPVRVETLTGGIVTVSPDSVEIVAKRNPLIEVYERKSRFLEDTVDEHWELQEWCRQNSLRQERELELAHILRLEPQHEPSHRLLGHIQHEGKWMSRDDAMASKGYVKYKGKYLFPQEVELLEMSQTQRAAELVWFKKFHQWKDWLHSGNSERQIAAKRELDLLKDPNAVNPLIKQFRNDQLDDVRLLFVRTLSRMGGPVAVQALVLQSLFDTSPVVRVAALEGIGKEGRKHAIPIYVKALKDELNAVVLRAAVALGHLAGREVVPDLIEALVTSHVYRVQVREAAQLAPGAIPVGSTTPVIVEEPVDIPLFVPGVPFAMSLSRPGTPYIPGSPGNATQPQVYQQPTPVTRVRTVQVTQDHENIEVLTALKKITGQDFSYDKRTWRLWWTTHHSAN